MSSSKRFSSLTVIAAIFMLSGCASIVSTSKWPIKIDSVPQDADITVIDAGDGSKTFSGKTPATVTLSSNGGFFKGKEYDIQVSKEGYRAQTAKINSEVNGWYLGNLIFGGLIGMLIVDPATGAMWTLDNKYINLTLEKSAHAAPEIKTPSQKVDISPKTQEPQPIPKEPITSTPITPPSGTTKTGTITWTFINIRSGPGDNYSVVASVKQSDKVVVTGESGEWLNVRLENGQQGWVRKPDYALAQSKLGMVYSKSGRNTEAILAYKEAIRIRPDYALAHYNLGVVYVKSGRNTEALTAFNQSIRINPDDADAHYNLGVVYVRLGRNTEAISAFKQAIRIKPDYAEAHYALGLNYGSLERHREAIEPFNQAIRIEPNDARAHYYLGAAYLRIGDTDSALNQQKILKTLDNDLALKLFNLIYK